MEVTVTIAVLDSVTLIVREFGDTQTLKSAGASVTFNVTRVHLMIAGLDVSVPVTFRT
jgi:NaMN:DMB phosphoribosyltransferase